jgi:hypothetical protein
MALRSFFQTRRRTAYHYIKKKRWGLDPRTTPKSHCEMKLMKNAMSLHEDPPTSTTARETFLSSSTLVSSASVVPWRISLSIAIEDESDVERMVERPGQGQGMVANLGGGGDDAVAGG